MMSMQMAKDINRQGALAGLPITTGSQVQVNFSPETVGSLMYHYTAPAYNGGWKSAHFSQQAPNTTIDGTYEVRCLVLVSVHTL